jgi:hypothetical protein
LQKGTICKIRKEGQGAGSKGVQLPTARKAEISPPNKIITVDMDRCMMRQKFMKYYEHHKEIPTIRKLPPTNRKSVLWAPKNH